jgi:hypothetical protein
VRGCSPNAGERAAAARNPVAAFTHVCSPRTHRPRARPDAHWQPRPAPAPAPRLRHEQPKARRVRRCGVLPDIQEEAPRPDKAVGLGRALPLAERERVADGPPHGERRRRLEEHPVRHLLGGGGAHGAGLLERKAALCGRREVGGGRGPRGVSGRRGGRARRRTAGWQARARAAPGNDRSWSRPAVRAPGRRTSGKHTAATAAAAPRRPAATACRACRRPRRRRRRPPPPAAAPWKPGRTPWRRRLPARQEERARCAVNSAAARAPRHELSASRAAECQTWRRRRHVCFAAERDRSAECRASAQLLRMANKHTPMNGLSHAAGCRTSAQLPVLRSYARRAHSRRAPHVAATMDGGRKRWLYRWCSQRGKGGQPAVGKGGDT